MAQSEKIAEKSSLAGAEEAGPYGRYSTGILPFHVLTRLAAEKKIILSDTPFLEGQIQPASIDLRLGKKAYRVRASFLPGSGTTVAKKLQTVAMHEIDLTQGAVLETGCVYVVELLETVEL